MDHAALALRLGYRRHRLRDAGGLPLTMRSDTRTLLLTGSGITEYPNAGYSRILGGSGTSMDVRLGANTSVALQINTLGQAAQTINSTWSEIDHD